MGLCFSSVSHMKTHQPGPEKSKVAFSAGLETLLRDADLHKSPSRQSKQIEVPADRLDTLRWDANGQLLNSSNAKTRSPRNAGEGKPSMTTTRKSVDRKLSTTATRNLSDSRKPSTASIRKSVDGRPMATSTRKSVDGRPMAASTRRSVDGRPMATSTRTAVDRRPSNPLTRKSLVGNTAEGPSTAEGSNGVLHMSKDSDVDSDETAARSQRWQSLDHLLKETKRESVDGRKSMSRYSPTRRQVVPSPNQGYGDGHGTGMSPDPRPLGRKSVDRKPAAERKPVGRNSVARKPEGRNLVDSSNSMEMKTVERNSVARKPVGRNLADSSDSMERKTVERKSVSERKPAESKFVERKSVDRNLVDRTSVDKKFVEARKSVERKSVDRKSVDRKLASERVRAVEHSVVGATNMSGRRSVDRVGDGSSPDHHSNGLKKTTARNGYFTPERTGTLNSLPDSRQHHHPVDRRFRSGFADLDFLTQKFLIDNPEQTIQSRIDGAHSGRRAGQHDPADSSSSRDVRSAEQITEFTKSCRESAAKAAARDLDAFKSLTSVDTSTDSSAVTV